MQTDRPKQDAAAQAAWDAQYLQLIEELNVKLRAYNAENEAYNSQFASAAGHKIKCHTFYQHDITDFKRICHLIAPRRDSCGAAISS